LVLAWSDGDAATRPALGGHTTNDANDKCGWSTRLAALGPQLTVTSG
jgi:hypothetical protein